MSSLNDESKCRISAGALPSPIFAPLRESNSLLGNEKWHGWMLDVEEWERLRVEGLQRLIASPERAAEIQRAQAYEDIGRPFYYSETRGRTSYRAQPIRVPKKLREQGEEALAKFGLSFQQQKLQDTQDIVVPVPEGTPKVSGVPIKEYAFAKFPSMLSDGSALFSMLADEDLFRGDPRESHNKQLAFSVVKIRKFRRLIPNWAWNEAQFREVIVALYPKWRTHELWRKRTEKIAAILYRFFCLLQPTAAIAEELFPEDWQVSPAATIRKVENRIDKARRAAEQLFGKDGQAVSQPESRAA